MQILRVEDPRDPVHRASRDQLWDYAKKNGIKEIPNPDVPQKLMVQILLAKGIRDIGVPTYVLGQPSGVVEQSKPSPQNSVEVDELADLARQFSTTPVAKMNINELRDACRARGIKMARTDKMSDLRKKLEQNAA